MLAGALGARHVSVGENFRFGHGARGDADLLPRAAGVRDRGRAAGRARRRARSPRAASGSCWSSGRRAGGAPSCSARRSSSRARSCEGDARGRELGMPTANLSRRPSVVVPGRGHLRGDSRSVTPAAHQHRRPADVRERRRAAGRGAPDRLRRRPLRPARCGSRFSSACATRSASTPPRSWSSRCSGTSSACGMASGVLAVAAALPASFSAVPLTKEAKTEVIQRSPARGRHRLARGPGRAADGAHQRAHRAPARAQEGPPLAPRPADAGRPAPAPAELPEPPRRGPLPRARPGARPPPLAPSAASRSSTRLSASAAQRASRC